MTCFSFTGSNWRSGGVGAVLARPFHRIVHIHTVRCTTLQMWAALRDGLSNRLWRYCKAKIYSWLCRHMNRHVFWSFVLVHRNGFVTCGYKQETVLCILTRTYYRASMPTVLKLSQIQLYNRACIRLQRFPSETLKLIVVVGSGLFELTMYRYARRLRSPARVSGFLGGHLSEMVQF